AADPQEIASRQAVAELHALLALKLQHRFIPPFVPVNWSRTRKDVNPPYRTRPSGGCKGKRADKKGEKQPRMNTDQTRIKANNKAIQLVLSVCIRVGYSSATWVGKFLVPTLRVGTPLSPLCGTRPKP